MNKSIKILLTILVATSLVACSGSESSAQNAVAAQLKDPDSAKFGKFTKFGGDLGPVHTNFDIIAAWKLPPSNSKSSNHCYLSQEVT
jgi:hypothetical protein